jgi:hypothetical protein
MKKLRQERHRKRMNNAGQIFVVAGICRPDGAWWVGDVLATKMPLLTELGGGINDSVLDRFLTNLGSSVRLTIEAESVLRSLISK